MMSLLEAKRGSSMATVEVVEDHLAQIPLASRLYLYRVGLAGLLLGGLTSLGVGHLGSCLAPQQSHLQEDL